MSTSYIIQVYFPKKEDSSHWIYKILEENFREDPLKLWTQQLIAQKIREGKR